MKNCEIIEKEIAELETRQIDYSTAEKLAWLYVVRDHIKHHDAHEPAVEEQAEVHEIKATAIGSGSEFMNTIEGKDLEQVLAVIDETMDTIQTTFPRIYNCAMQKLRDI